MSLDIHDLDTRSIPRGDGIRDLTITDRWNTTLGRANGGYVFAMMLRGLTEEVATHDPLVASATFLAAPDPGPAELHTTVLRRGRRIQSATATLHQGGRIASQMTASFGEPPQPADTPVPDQQHLSAPWLPPVENCVNPKDAGGPTGGIFDRVEHRLPPGPSIMVGNRSGRLDAALWQRLENGRTVEPHLLAMLTDTYAPVVMEAGARGSLTVQLTVHLHGLPTSDWIATRVATKHVKNGFHEEDCELFDADGTLLAQSRQFAMMV